MSEKVKIGKLIEGDAARDAIHIAIAPVVAGQQLQPGELIGLQSAGSDVAVVCANPIGIVDPFLKTTVVVGRRFYMFLLPNTITSLRHEWIHPAFVANADEKLAAAKGQIQKAADDAGIDYEEIMEAAERYLKYSDYLIQGGRWEGHRLPADFWDHYETVTGVKVGDNERGSFFSCSC